MIITCLNAVESIANIFFLTIGETGLHQVHIRFMPIAVRFRGNNSVDLNICFICWRGYGFDSGQARSTKPEVVLNAIIGFGI